MKVTRLLAYAPAAFTPTGDTFGTHSVMRPSRPQGHNAPGMIKSSKNPIDPIWNRTRNFPTCSATAYARMYKFGTRNDYAVAQVVINGAFLLQQSTNCVCFGAILPTLRCKSWGMNGYLFIPDSPVWTEVNGVWSTSVRCDIGRYLICPLQSSPCFNYWLLAHDTHTQEYITPHWKL
jgi:hypothetical protein